jgi:hypothetical protein
MNSVLYQRFLEISKEHLAFLAQKYNMHLSSDVVRSHYACVRYESAVAWLEMSLDRHSLFVEVGIPRKVERASLCEILDFMAANDKKATFMVSDEHSLTVGIKRLTQYVGIYCRDALFGDSKYFTQLKNFNAKKQDKLIRAVVIDEIERKAVLAWEGKNYQAVIDIYNSIRDELRPIQKKRLEIALRQQELSE